MDKREITNKIEYIVFIKEEYQGYFQQTTSPNKFCGRILRVDSENNYIVFEVGYYDQLIILPINAILTMSPSSIKWKELMEGIKNDN